MSKPTEQPPTISRRQFLYQMAASGASISLISQQVLAATQLLTPINIDNPLTQYPNRNWEQVYRNLYHYDSSFTFLCAPNDTHNCLLRGFVKNGVVTRIAPTYGYHKATDLEGHSASRRWDPRCCQKGLALVRRFYGDRRCKRPLVRQGFLDWVNADFPRDPKISAVDQQYLQRGQDKWVSISWDEAFELSAKALINIAHTYSGAAGQEKLRAQGYDPLMVEATQGAGTQTLKFRGGMPPLGMTRVFAQYRLANAMALLDDKLRHPDPEQVLGARGFDNYSWHTDLPPGHPMVTGQQSVDFDLCNVEHAHLLLVWGMNWITTKMPDAHWMTEARMKGTKVVVIAAEYSATSSKGDEVVVVRSGTTPALALGIAQVLISEQLYDLDYVKAYEDFQAPEAKQWFIAYQADNPMAQWQREQPVEELVAEGWGSLTTQSQSVTSGQGVWQKGHWTVMFSRPLTTEDKNDHQFKLGQKSQIAFAVWQGAADNVGGRKHWSNWITYAIEP